METGKAYLAEMLNRLVEFDGSDLHLTGGVKPYMRINGKLSESDFPLLSKTDCEELILSLLTESGKKAFFELKTLDFSLSDEFNMGRFRVNIYQQGGSIAAAIRRLPKAVPSIEELGLPVATVKNFCNLPNGLVLLCGPVGTGKTTTLAAMIDYINKTRNAHVITIEDPVEYIHTNQNSLIHQREIRRDAHNFKDALKFILREDPDVVVIGEMRDLETIESATIIAETGHLVLATLHTGDASESIRRIIDVFPAEQQGQVIAQLAGCFSGVINQVLLPRIDKVGRVLATEVMVVTPAIQNLIRENKTEQIYSHIQMGSDFGMRTLNQSLVELVKKKKISKDIALLKTRRAKELIKLLEN
jgi:twitching motility protein PilT